MTAQSLHSTTTDAITAADARLILELRLLIARAGNRDSLGWWDDESLTADAGFVLERIFPMAPALAARSLALSAAVARHVAVCAEQEGALHLYRLAVDNQDQLAQRVLPLQAIPLPEGPITTMEALRQELLSRLRQPAEYKVVRRTNARGLHIAVPPCPRGTSPLLHRAWALAWAYLEGAPQQPVFPFLLETKS